MHGGLVPFASLGVGRPGVVGAGSWVLGGPPLPKFLLLGAGGVGATPRSHSPLPQPSLPEKLVQLFSSAANNSCFFFGGAPPTSRPLGVGRGLGSLRPATTRCRRRPLPREGRAPTAARRNLGQRPAVRPRVSFGTRRSNRRWGGDSRRHPLRPPAG